MWKGADRTVNCRYNPEVPGKYTINIKWEDEHVKVRETGGALKGALKFIPVLGLLFST